MTLTVIDIILMVAVFLLAVYILVRPFLKRMKNKGSQCATCPYCTQNDCPARKIQSKIEK
jgi:hypothetical protein